MIKNFFDSFSVLAVMLLIPVFVSLFFPLLSIRDIYFAVFFYLGIARHEKITMTVMLVSSVFIDALYAEPFGFTFLYSILIYYLFCDYVNLVCVISRSFSVIWWYYLIFIVCFNLFNFSVLSFYGVFFDKILMLRQAVLMLIIFPFLCKLLGVLIEDE